MPRFNDQWYPASRPSNWRPPAVTSAQREEIRARCHQALEDEPGLSRAAFARRIAGEYGVSAMTIRRILYSS